MLEAIDTWLPNAGIGGAIAGLVIYFWRMDRKTWISSYERDRRASEERYKEIAQDFREIVQSNTKAITELTSHLEVGIRCPIWEDSMKTRTREGGPRG